MRPLQILFFLLITYTSYASRSLYVDNFDEIIGNELKENQLLSYAEDNGFNTLLLYNLYEINITYPLNNTETNAILAQFIAKAKNQYAIDKIGATAENTWFFTTVIDNYNNSRTLVSEKIDIYNLEFEYWNTNSTAEDAYYCITYLTNAEKPCTTDGAFEYYIETLNEIKSLAENNIHNITVETYVGWITESQALEIGNLVDNIRVHAYTTDPTSSYTYTKERLTFLANTHPNINISIIFSAENNFMKEWLTTNSISEAEELFLDTLNQDSDIWIENINISEFTYFNYSCLQTDNTLNIKDKYDWNELKIQNPIKNKTVEIYDMQGRKILSFKDTQIKLDHLESGMYFARISNRSKQKSITIIKN